VRHAIVEGGRAEFGDVLAAIWANGALDYVRDVARREAALASAAIEQLPGSSHKDSLLELAAFSVARRY
jgi:octaprenyl-diphosphate synthase